jgi:hypothetical protein
MIETVLCLTVIDVTLSRKVIITSSCPVPTTRIVHEQLIM